MFKFILQIILFLVALSNAHSDNSVNCNTKKWDQMHLPECFPNLPKYVTPDAMKSCNLPEEEAEEEGGFCIHGEDLPCDSITCVFNNKNLMNGNKINYSNMQTFMEKELPTEFKTVIQDGLKNCSNSVNFQNICEPKMFIICFTNYLLKNSPDTAWTNNEECNGLKKFLKSCPMPHHE